MSPDRFAILQSEFEALSKRLKETQEPTERKAILKKVRQVINEMDALMETRQTSLHEEQKRVRDAPKARDSD